MVLSRSSPPRFPTVSFATALLLVFATPSLHAQSQWIASVAGSGFATYTHQSSLRGSDDTAAWGWVHGAFGRSFARGSLTADAMLTLDPLVQGDCGYSRLMAGWALCSDAPLEDRTHPQPFVMRLGVRAERAIGPARLALDGALVGDPPLGVPSYMHRASAAADPVMPMTMAELTPAHAVGGVLTVGAAVGPLEVEASAFNGGGGAADRWDLALGGLHSWAARLRWRPTAGLALYGGFGELEASEGHHEGGGAMRVESAGVEWRGMVGAQLEVAATLAGAQRTHGEHTERAGLLEGLARVGRQTLFARVERTDRSLVGLQVVDHPDGSHDHLMTFLPYDVGEASVGYSLRAFERWGTGLSIGGRYGLAHVSSLLVHGYGAQTAHTFSVFLNLGTPGAGGASHHPMH
jgi:hypothetical protein